MKRYGGIIATGAIIGAVAVLLVFMGNPGNMGFCIACFLRDIAGATKLHSAAIVQYLRPEIIGLILGACLTAFFTKEWKPRGGSAPATRFALGFVVMVGALMFLGCPLRMVLRIGGGDCNAIVALVGFAGGIFVGVKALEHGFSLKRAYPLGKTEGLVLPVIALFLFVLWQVAPSLFVASESGPGSMAAPVALALAAGLLVGGLAQRSRLCMVGGIRDAIMFQDFYLISGFAAIIAVSLLGNIMVGKFLLGFAGQPVAHTDGLWNFLGMFLVGWASVLLGGCPLRQLILAGEGNGDATMAVLGMVIGAAFCHNFGLASSAEGPTMAGQIAVILGLLVTAIVTVMNLQRKGV